MLEDFINFYHKDLENLIDTYIEEDIGPGDLTSAFSLYPTSEGTAQLLVRQECTVAGIEMTKLLLSRYDPKLELQTYYKDGDYIEQNKILLEIKGSAQSILSIERLLLNCIGRMTGIATATNDLVNKISATDCKILDTRKTTPGFRLFEKWAVLIGGGENHRMGLYDVILLKDNHIDFAGGISKALKKLSASLESFPSKKVVIIEARDLAEVREILKFKIADRILLDNFPINLIPKAIDLINGRVQVEVSGNINKDNILEYAIPGVKYISVGAITHSVSVIDLSLLKTPIES